MKENKGFTLIELMIVIAIVAILLAVFVPSLKDYAEKTNKKQPPAIEEKVNKEPIKAPPEKIKPL